MADRAEEHAPSWPLRPAVPDERPSDTRVPAWVDKLIASDPGLNRLRLASQIVLTIGIAMLVEWVFVQLTHAMEMPGAGPAAAAQHHAVTVIAVMVGAVVGMLAAFSGGAFEDRRTHLGGLVLMAVLMIAGLALGLALSPHRTPSLVMLVVVLALGAYCRRFGPVGFFGGQMVFMGDFFGFFLGGAVVFGDIGWLSAEIALGMVVAILAQFTVFYPAKRRSLARMQRSYDARRRDVVDYALRLLDERAEPEAAYAGLQRRLVRLNETALMIDGHLNDVSAIPPGWSAQTLHQILFDAELAVTNMARFVTVVALADDVPGDVRDAVRRLLVAVRDRDFERADADARALVDGLAARAEPLAEERHVVVHRLGLAVHNYAEAQRRWREAGRQARASGTRTETALETPVELASGFLKGSVGVSSTASEEPGPGYGKGHRWHFWHHVPLTSNVRVAIQMAVAVTATIVLGELLSGKRFYWAVIAAFVTFMGANNATEQVRKGVNRVIGTFVGAIVGAVLAHLVGARTHLAIAVILVAIFLGIYLMRVSYIFMVMGITVMLSQLYVQLGEFSNGFLLLRVEETALGAAVAAITVVSVLPLRTGRVARVASREYLTALGEVVAATSSLLAGTGSVDAVRSAARGLDDAYQALISLTPFLRRPVLDRGRTEREEFQWAAAAARNYARNLMVDSPGAVASAEDVRGLVEGAADQFAASMEVLVRWYDTGSTDGAPYVRSAWLFARVGTACEVPFGTPLWFTLRDLQLLDGTLATMASVLGVPVTALDADEVSV